MADFNYQVLEKLSEINESLATTNQTLAVHINEQSHLKILVNDNKTELDKLKIKHENCKARKKFEGYGIIWKDIILVVSGITAIIGLLKMMVIK